jgi:hypothetical protein
MGRKRQMLAEIFMLRFEAKARLSKPVVPAFGRFVPFDPATPLGPRDTKGMPKC